jgi:hypothetical protein
VITWQLTVRRVTQKSSSVLLRDGARTDPSGSSMKTEKNLLGIVHPILLIHFD